MIFQNFFPAIFSKDSNFSRQSEDFSNVSRGTTSRCFPNAVKFDFEKVQVSIANDPLRFERSKIFECFVRKHGRSKMYTFILL